MKTTSLVATLVAASALVLIQPVFAQTNDLSAVENSSDSPTVPDLGESWDVGPPSLADPALAPAPEEPVDREPAPVLGGFTPADPGSPWMQRPEGPFAQPFVNPTIPATGMRELPGVGTPHGGLNGRVR